MGQRFWRRFAILANVLGIAAIGVMIIQFGTSAENSARVRNSLIAKIGEASDLTWLPDEVPETFLLEGMAPPKRLVEVAEGLFSDSEKDAWNAIDKALLIAEHLVNNQSHGEPIQSDTITAYEEITAQGKGYCADYSQVFSALAIAAGIQVREWGMGFEGFGLGHSINDVFDGRSGKWILIDSFHSMYVVDAETGDPLSVLEFQEKLRSGRADQEVRVMPISQEKFAFRSQEKALSYYERGADQFYLFWGNNVFTYDEHPLVRRLRSFPRALEVTGAILVGVHPAIRIAKTSTNRHHIAKLEWTRIKFLSLFVLFLIASALLVYQGWSYRRVPTTGDDPPR